jgi:UDP-N-acetylglucosamine--N-acetylmuramyl-(pentapeptide) pyrophosphoryl-undecaprenol N-acetylglucosamine transferase
MIAVSTNISSTDTHTAAVSAPRVLIAAGGTGGHVYPGIAIADAVKELHPDAAMLFVGTRNRMEWKSVPKAGYEIKSVWISGFHRRLTPQNLLFPLKLIVSLIQSFFILKRYNPGIVVCCGGFASGPIGWMAAMLHIPLILQEQNSYPGVTNRLLAKYADVIFTAFEEAANHFPPEKVILSGNPVRSSIKKIDRKTAYKQFDFTYDQPVLLLIGGSGGAKSLNDAMKKNLDFIHNELGIQVIWQCGKKYFPDLQQSIHVNKYPNLRLMEFIDNMPAAYEASDLVISRAGALSCSELMLTGKPSILVPSPNVAGDHQSKNASSMVDQGAAILLNDSEVFSRLGEVVESVIFDDEQLKTMSRAARSMAKPDAATAIAKEIEIRSKGTE